MSLLPDRWHGESDGYVREDWYNELEAKNTALVEAVEKVLPRINPQYQTHAQRCAWIDSMWEVEETLTKALAAAEEES
jgi:hypothetical protein